MMKLRRFAYLFFAHVVALSVPVFAEAEAEAVNAETTNETLKEAVSLAEGRVEATVPNIQTNLSGRFSTANGQILNIYQRENDGMIALSIMDNPTASPVRLSVKRDGKIYRAKTMNTTADYQNTSLAVIGLDDRLQLKIGSDGQARKLERIFAGAGASENPIPESSEDVELQLMASDFVNDWTAIKSSSFDFSTTRAVVVSADGKTTSSYDRVSGLSSNTIADLDAFLKGQE